MTTMSEGYVDECGLCEHNSGSGECCGNVALLVS